MTTTLPFITAGASLVSTGTQLFSTLSQSKAEEIQAVSKGESEAKAQEFNIGVSQQEIAISKAKRALEKKIEQKRIKSFTSTQNAIFAKSGVMLSGSPLAVIEESIAEAELDVLIGDINSNIEQNRLQSEIEQRQQLAQQSREKGIAAGKKIKSEGRSKAATTLLTELPKNIQQIADLIPNKKKTTTTAYKDTSYLEVKKDISYLYRKK